jgi:predicted dehydrogenase
MRRALPLSTQAMSSAPLGFAVVGTGMIAGYHAQSITRTPGARLIGVVSRSPERGAAFAAEHGGIVTATVEEMVARPDVHVVAVTTPSGAHLDPALTAIRAGKHVMIEKPLEVTPARIDQIIAAADQAGVKIAAIFQGRFGEGAQTVKAAVDQGRFGRLVLASAYVKWHRSAEYYRTPWKGTWDLGRRRRPDEPGDPRRRPPAMVRRPAVRGLRPDRPAGPHPPPG